MDLQINTVVPKILLVDDRADNLISLETILEPDGYHFVKANSGSEALKILLTEMDFALILMDVKMPNLNGLETATLIYERKKLRHIPIIFLSANQYGEDKIFQGYKTGAVDYIYKPINPELVRAKVSVFVDLYKKNRQLLAQEEYLISVNKNLELEIRERKISEEMVKQLNEVLVENISRLQSVNKELDNFVYMVSHDLQEPLRKIRIFCDYLEINYKSVLSNDGKNSVEKIQRSCKQMQELIQDVLTFSTLTMEKRQFEKIDLNELVKDVLNEMESYIITKNASISVENLPSVHANPVLMRPLFHNLISNSLKYSKEAISPVIRISSDSAIDNGSIDESLNGNTHFRIMVEDNGIGFDQEHAEQIFGMFKRLHAKNQYHGTGIGLAICKKIAEEHNGTIKAISKVNEGSTFVVSLPMKAMHSAL